MPLKFQRVKVREVIFAGWLQEQYKNSKFPLPKNVTHMRNIAINMTIVEAICDFASIFFYIRRRSRLVLAIDILNFLFVFIGLYAKLTLSYLALAAHALYTLSIVGGFYVYILIDSYIVEYLNQEHLHHGQMS